jgi:hypothetical protein
MHSSLTRNIKVLSAWIICLAKSHCVRHALWVPVQLLPSSTPNLPAILHLQISKPSHNKFRPLVFQADCISLQRGLSRCCGSSSPGHCTPTNSLNQIEPRPFLNIPSRATSTRNTTSSDTEDAEALTPSIAVRCMYPEITNTVV